MVDKGKKIAFGNDSAGKRKRGGLGDGDKSGHKNKRPGVLQFFEDAADDDEDEPSDDDLFDSMFDDEFMDDELDTQPKVKNELGKAQNLPFIPKEEEIDEEAFDKIMEERFKQGSRFIKYAEDDYENKRLVDRDYRMPSSEDPTVWKVKCVGGGSGDLGFEEFPSSPKSPLSPKKPWQEKEFNSDFRSEHLAEVRGKSFGMSSSKGVKWIGFHPI
ncbi:hypothetical protein QYF36_011281 [Acer negundo]|nr:hypothetical protein QYF36_011281 [Acer negundo]